MIGPTSVATRGRQVLEVKQCQYLPFDGKTSGQCGVRGVLFVFQQDGDLG